MVRIGHEYIVDRGLDDMPQTVQLQRSALQLRPDLGSFEGHLGAGVEHAPVYFVGNCAWPACLAVVGESGSGSRSDVQPAKKSFRQQNLVKSIGSRPGVVVCSERSH